MQVVAVASQKGGSGKTTLAGHIAVQAEMAGAGPVAVVDTDPQASLADWWNERTATTPVFMRTSVANLTADLKRLRDHNVKLVVDPAGGVEETRHVLSPARRWVRDTPPGGRRLRQIEGGGTGLPSRQALATAAASEKVFSHRRLVLSFRSC